MQTRVKFAVLGRIDVRLHSLTFASLRVMYYFKKVKVIPEVNFNEEFNGDFHFDLEVYLHGFFKVNFVFLKWKPPFLHLQSIEQKILGSDTYSSHRSIVTFKVN